MTVSVDTVSEAAPPGSDNAAELLDALIEALVACDGVARSSPGCRRSGSSGSVRWLESRILWEVRIFPRRALVAQLSPNVASAPEAAATAET
jgi:hypothetical protein